MSEVEPQQTPIPEGLRPGSVISLVDMQELMTFEDLLAPLVDPTYDPELWAVRPNLNDWLRPPDFNGTIKDVTLTVMEDPYDRLLDARDRGWTFFKWQGNNLQRTQPGAEQFISKYQGFEFDAEAHSTSPGIRGRIEAELWYYPAKRGFKKAGTPYTQTSASGERRTYVTKQDYYSNEGSQTGETIRRVITKPRLDSERFMAAHDTSCAIGFAVLSEALRHPISVPMRH